MSTDGCDLLAWQISDRSGAVGAVTEWLRGRLPAETLSTDETSVFLGHAQAGGIRANRDEEPRGLLPSHYCITLKSVVLCVCVWAHCACS